MNNYKPLDISSYYNATIRDVETLSDFFPDIEGYFSYEDRVFKASYALKFRSRFYLGTTLSFFNYKMI